jgi:hypothetical protein
MGKIFGILLMVAGIWVGMTLYTEGTRDAFGGVFASFSDSQEQTRAPLERIRDKLSSARRAQLERIERQVED